MLLGRAPRFLSSVSRHVWHAAYAVGRVRRLRSFLNEFGRRRIRVSNYPARQNVARKIGDELRPPSPPDVAERDFGVGWVNLDVGCRSFRVVCPGWRLVRHRKTDPQNDGAGNFNPNKTSTHVDIRQRRARFRFAFAWFPRPVPLLGVVRPGCRFARHRKTDPQTSGAGNFSRDQDRGDEIGRAANKSIATQRTVRYLS